MAILARRYRVVHGADAPAPPDRTLGYLAGDDATRAAELNEALGDQRVRAIFCSRGGYGAMRILDRLDGEALRRRRIPLVGFSDITALHAWAARLGVPTVHGPVVSQLHRLPQEQVEHLFALLEGERPAPLSGLTPLHPGTARGPLLGGNLTLLCHLLGTPHLPAFDGAVLLIEEVNEPPYRLDRMLTQLALAGVFERLAGVVVGQVLLPGTVDEKARALRRAVLADRLGQLGLPVVSDAPVGHGGSHLALPLGLPVTLDADAGTLTLPALSAPPGRI